MRPRLPWCAPLAAALLLTACPRSDRDVALPWHGPVTRLLWTDIARGAIPMPRCRAWEAGDSARVEPLTRLLNQLTTSDGFLCDAASADSTFGVTVHGHAGAVDSYETRYKRPLPGPDGMDSTYNALSALYGPGKRCEMSRTDGGYSAVGATWRARGYMVTMFPPGIRPPTTRLRGEQMIIVAYVTDTLDYCGGRDTVSTGVRFGWTPGPPGLRPDGGPVDQ